MYRIKQVGIVFLLSCRSLHRRLASSWVIVVALMGVSAVLLSLLSMREGIKRDYLSVGHVDRAIITSAGSDREPSSSIPAAWLDPIRRAQGVRRRQDGFPLVDAEIGVGVEALTKTGSDASIDARGIGPIGLELSPEVRMVDGRPYRFGTREILAGDLARRKFSGLEVGDQIDLKTEGRMIDGPKWTIVGHYRSNSFIDSGLIADPEVLRTALQRTSYNSVLVGLQTESALASLRKTLDATAKMSVTVERQSDFWIRQYQNLPDTWMIIDYFVSALLATGAISGILHTMHATVGSRAGEIAILRAVGFSGIPIAIGIVLEAMVFACAGAALGTAMDRLWLDGYPISGAYGIFRIAVTPYLFFVALAWASIIALIGAIVPAVQEARLPVVDTLSRS